MSRLVGRLREDFETWRARELADEDIRYVFMGPLLAQGALFASRRGIYRRTVMLV